MMKRWVWRVLLAAAVLAALTGTALAADPVVVDGFELTLNTAGTEWTVTGFDGKEEDVVIPSLYENKPVTAIADSAFVTDPANPPEKQLTKITIPGTVKTVGAHAFEKCTSLNTVMFQDYINAKGDVERNATIGESAFAGCTALENLTLSSNTLTIGANAFDGCSRLPSVLIPKFVDEIKDSAFANCANLKEVTFLDVATKFTGAFDSLAGMRRIHCPGNSQVYNAIRLLLGPTKTERIVHTISDVKTEVVTKASCTSAGQVRVSFTCPPVTKEVPVTGADGKPATDADGNPITTTETTPCDTYKGGKYEVTRTTSILPHTIVTDPATDAVDCQHPAKGPGSHCSVCNTVIDEPKTLDNGPHKYTVETREDLFKPTCTEDGLIRITKVCSVCGASPTCYECDEREKALEDARGAAEKKQEELDKAISENNAAIAAYTKASADLEEAKKALKDAEDARTEAIANFAKAAKREPPPTTVEECEPVFENIKKSYEDAQKAVQAKQDEIEGLQENIANLEEQLEAAADADKAGIEEQIEAKKTALGTAEGELETLKTAAATAKEKWDPVNAAYTAVLTAKVACERAEKANSQATEAEGKASSAKSEKGTALEKAKEANDDASKAIEAAKEALITHTTEEAHKEKADAQDLEDGLIDGDPIPALGHKWLEPPYVKPDENNKIPDCVTGSSIILELWHTCEVCGKEEKTGDNEVITPAGKHKRPDGAEGTEKTPATCTEPGIKVYDYECEICGATVKGEEEVIPATEHHWIDRPDLDESIKAPTCEEPGLKNTYHVCDNENCPFKGEPQLNLQNVRIDPNAGGHKWGAPVKDESKKDVAPTCGKEGTSYVIVTCQNEGCGKTEHREITLPPTGEHDWGEWTTKDPTLTEPGEKKRVCKNCGEEDIIVLPATGGSTDPDDPSQPDNPDNPGTPSEPEPDTYPITVVQGAGGSTRVNRTTAEAGDSVTITVSPDSGYELDLIRAIGGGTSVLSLTDLGSGQHRFTMPASSVEIRVTFERRSSGSGWASAPGSSSAGGSDPRRTTDVIPTQAPTLSAPQAWASEQRFQDIPVSHWAAGEIQWANQMGYMNGSGGRFNPDGNISQQQMWMVLARLTGSNPANMEEARRWAAERSFASGSSPTGPVARHQLVTALYRCAHLMGSSNRNTTSLAGYPDSRTVPTVARDAYSWALANGIISGTSNGRLDPNGTLTRAQFAVILYRYSQRI